MIKTIEQINREFLNEYSAENNTEEHAVNQDDTAETAAETIMPTAAVTAIPTTAPPNTMTEEPEEKQSSTAVAKSVQRKQPLWKDMLFLLLKVAVIIMAFALLFTFLFGLIRYQEPSMLPAIKDGDLVIFYRYKKAGYMQQDAIVLEYNGKKQVRRVVAVAGDVVDITESGFSVNGAIQQEPGIYQDTERYIEGVSFPLTVPEGHVFVLGDNRTGATDSRIYGSVDIEDTLGKVIAVIRRRSI